MRERGKSRKERTETQSLRPHVTASEERESVCVLCIWEPYQLSPDFEEDIMNFFLIFLHTIFV